MRFWSVRYAFAMEDDEQRKPKNNLFELPSTSEQDDGPAHTLEFDHQDTLEILLNTVDAIGFTDSHILALCMALDIRRPSGTSLLISVSVQRPTEDNTTIGDGVTVTFDDLPPYNSY